jgi:hypothetical protein
LRQADEHSLVGKVKIVLEVCGSHVVFRLDLIEVQIIGRSAKKDSQ